MPDEHSGIGTALNRSWQITSADASPAPPYMRDAHAPMNGAAAPASALWRPDLQLTGHQWTEQQWANQQSQWQEPTDIKIHSDGDEDLTGGSDGEAKRTPDPADRMTEEELRRWFRESAPRPTRRRLRFTQKQAIHTGYTPVSAADVEQLG